jgi:Flp pilus assembly protein TadD
MQPLDSQGTSHDTLDASKEEVLEATRRPGAALPMSLMLKLSAQMLMPTDLKPSKKTLNEPQSNVGPEVFAIQKEASALPPSPQAVSQLPATTPSPSPPAPSPPAPLAPLTNPVAAAAGHGAAVTPNTATAVPVVTVNRQLALQENMQQAQQLWQSGSREAATEVLRSTLQSVERSTEVSSAETIHVLREWARMALALDRAAEVMALIKRHAGQLHVQGQGSGQVQADIWALQGHAAQRLGLHAEAVEAYQHALLGRPNEGRWLLASAVSLAASGQLEPAARQLQKVRAQGPVNPDILAYLKQAGVVLP